MSLIGFVILYMAVSIGIGLYAATRVKTTQDYALAGRSLPLAMVITATFATWFGSETVLGLPGRFIEGGIAGVIEEPFGSGMALILVGAFFASKLYKMNLLTIGSFYRHRYGKGIELACSIFIILSYLGWVAAQVSALGLVLNLVTEGAISVTLGMVIGTFVVLFYTMYGGMWSVALTDFFQMILIVAGLVVIAFFAGDMAGGADKVVAYASEKNLFNPWPEMTLHGWLFWISAAMTMMIGSIPQQDVFQRVMSAKSGKVAVAGPIIGGVFYIFFAAVPMFIVIASILVMPDVSGKMLAEDPQQLLPTMIRDYMPMWLRVLFFGAVLSAVMSTASATILAPSTTFVENVLKNFVHVSDKHEVRTMRATVLVFTLLVLVYALSVEGTAIYDMVAMAYQFPVVGAFWPLVLGLYWKRATTLGAACSIVLGGAAWVILTVTPLGEVIPCVLGGFVIAGIAMVAGSLVPVEANRRHVARWARESKLVEYRPVA
ncbi:MAG: sodium:solute symporter family protein [Sutterellaceae bacterium]|nr:sodium:solute symporter family protein [Sutterellaceae bacterium]MDD7441727.1 sodium:solute symporter family protein [Sutterellaceae bacterium]MDY2869263.1 sodium:solute symporter family protein [Mesosutterella sp.]